MRTTTKIGFWALLASGLATSGCGDFLWPRDKEYATGGAGGAGQGGETRTTTREEGGSGGKGGAGGKEETGGEGGAGGDPATTTTTRTCTQLPPPVITAPAGGATVAGDNVQLSWSGGAGPFEVEIAFDAAFTDPVPSISPFVTAGQSVVVNGLNGGYFHWRVRSLGDKCPGEDSSAAAEIHVTCKPLQMAADPVISYRASGLAWNAIDKEYGLIYAELLSGKWELRFLRTDRLGNVVLGPVPITGALLPDPGQGGYQSPGIVHVASADRWAIVYHREEPDQSYVTLFDDAGVVLATVALDDGSDSEFHSISYHAAADRIVTMTDSGGSVWQSVMQQFDASLSPVPGSGSVSLSACAAAPHNGAFGVHTALPDLAGGGIAALGVFNVRQSVGPDQNDLFAQRVDLSASSVAWPGSPCAGQPIVPGSANNKTYMVSLDWNPDDQSVAVAYAPKPFASGPLTDVHFALVDPISGIVTASQSGLNTGGAGEAMTGTPKVAWDGEEHLVLWNDGRDQVLPGEMQMRMTKLDGAANVLGGGDVLYPQGGFAHAIPGWSQRSLVGHDRIHTMVYDRRETSTSPNEVWMCIEPAYP